MRFRKFMQRDIEKLCEFKRRSRNISFHDISPNGDVSIFKKKLMKSINKDMGEIIILDHEEDIAGYVWCTKHKSNLGEFGVIRHIFVEKEHRKKGLGKALVKRAEQYFLKNNIKRIKSTVTLNNEKAIKLHHSLDYNKKRVVFEKILK